MRSRDTRTEANVVTVAQLDLKGEAVGSNLTRRNFLEVAAGASALTLAACANNDGAASEKPTVPDASS